MEYVLITGATSGIGLEMAKVFAKKGHALILVGRNGDKLKQVKKKLIHMMPREKKEDIREESRIVTITQDLSLESAAYSVYQEVKKRQLEVGILVNNAGAGYAGEFEKASEEQIISLIHLNISQLTLLCKYFGEDMKKRGTGRILNVASTGAYHPGAYIALYYATKAYVLSLSEAVYEEFKPYGVTVSCLCPGATLTQFQRASGRKDTGLAMKPGVVAEAAYRGLMKNKRIVVPGIRNKLMIRIPKFIAVPMIKKYQRRSLVK